MSLNTHRVTKLYWKTKELTEMLGVPSSKIRYWAEAFSIQVRESGDRHDWKKRYWSVENVEDLKTIYNLLKVKKMTIAGALKIFKVNEDLSKVGYLMKMGD